MLPVAGEPALLSSDSSRPSALVGPSRALDHARPIVTRLEWRWVGVVTLLLLLATQIPPTVQQLLGPPDRVHFGSYWYHADFSAYRAAMREGATTDSWLIHNPATAEPHHPALMFPLYVTLGKISAATGLSALAIFAIAELLTRIVLPVALYLFIATFLVRTRDRRLAFLLAACSGGLTLFLVPVLDSLGITTTLGGQPSVQVVTFALFFTAPHLGLGLAATLISMVSFRAACDGSRAALAVLATAVLVVALVHPFNLPTVIASFGLYSLGRFLLARRLLLGPFLAGATAVVAGAPLLLYNFVTFTLDPFWSKTHGEANTLPSPRPWELPMDYGVVFILAVVGAASLALQWRSRVAIREEPGASRLSPPGDQRPIDAAIPSPGLLLTWLATGIVCMYLPLAFQHRLAFGLQPAMAVLAAVGWGPTMRSVHTATSSFPPVTRRLLRRAFAPVVLVLALSLPATAFVALSVSAAKNAPIGLYVVDRDTYTVGEWIEAHSGPGDVTLGSLNTGEVLSGILPGRVVIGRRAGTIAFPEKLAMVEEAYRGELTSAELLAFLRANRVTYIVVGPEERKLGPNDPGLQLGLHGAIQIGAATAYHLPETL